ncbi:hypothetical protein SAMN05443377_12332 [Propionibacterium cyclohexanicum]|uniref:Uncharacterized protein n=1 Tax=Propionibacterium cyclohexanicum TaxID=64702 RepID=A0A1H9TI31_9ACTN|nr:hypothetical protein [Propionibacterium cyclohexanicum]SER96746.1 hypothetical protein SAMN05443377_12332 [Propionibacterium cyclohexanicum]
MEHPAETPQDETRHAVSRRTIVSAASWSIPVIAMTAVSPLAAASAAPQREFKIESQFGTGWYPERYGDPSAGALQYDTSKKQSHYFRVTGTEPGDVVTNIYFEVLLATNWPLPTFTAMDGSNPLWTTLAATGETETVGGVTYNVLRTDYTDPIVATGTVVEIPTEAYFRSPGPFYENVVTVTRRFVTVNGQTVTMVGPVLTIPSSILLSEAPTPYTP